MICKLLNSGSGPWSFQLTMSLQDCIDGLKAYGAKMAAGGKSVRTEIPKYSLKPADRLSLMRTVQSSDDKELRLGFMMTLPKQLPAEFSESSDDEKKQILSALLELARSISDDAEMPGVLETISILYGILQGQWPELVDLVLDNSDSDFLLKANAMAAFSFLRDPEFVEQHKEKMVPVLRSLLFARPELDLPRMSFVLLLVMCKPPLTQDLIDDVWKVVLASKSPEERQNSCVPAIFSLSTQEHYHSIQATPVKEIVGVFRDSSADLSARLQAIAPLIQFFAFFDNATMESVLTGMVEALTADFYEARELLDRLNDADLETLSPENVVMINTYLSHEMENSEHRNAALALLGSFIDLIVKEDESAYAKILGDILNGLKEGDFAAVVACVAIASLCEVMEEPSQELYEALLPHLVSENENLMFEAYNAMKSVYHTGLYSTPENEKALLEVYPKFDQSEFSRFAKLVTILLEDAEEAGLALAEPAYDFSLPLMSQDKPKTQNAVGLAIFTTLMTISTDFVEDHVVDCIEVSKRILESNESDLYPVAVNCLVELADQFKEKDTTEAILAVLPRLEEILDGKVSIEKKQFSKVANGTAELVQIYDLRDVAPKLCEMAMKYLTSTEGMDDDYSPQLLGSSIMMNLCETLVPDSAIEIFKSLAELLLTITDSDVAGNLIGALTGIVAKYRVDFDIAQDLADKLINGKVPTIQELFLMEDDHGMFKYLREFVKRFKKRTEPYCKVLMTMFPRVSTEILSGMSLPLEEAFSQKLFDEETASKFFVIIEQMVNENEDEVDTLSDLFGMILAIKRSYPQVINVPAMIKQLENINSAYGDLEEDGDFAMPLSLVLLELYSASEDGEAATPETLLEILSQLPYPAENCDLQFVLQAAMDLSKKDWAQKVAAEAIAILLARVLLMKKADLDEYQVDQQTLSQAKNCLKILCKASPELEQNVRKAVADTKAKQNSLNSILK